jgi:hypothetical protein
MARRLLVVAAMSSILCLCGVASAAPPEGSLRLTLVQSEEFLPLGPRSFAFNHTVYQQGQITGTSNAVCRFTGNFENPRCRLVLSVPQGKLFVFVRLVPDPRGSFTVTGGTGAYRGRTGVGIFRDLNAEGTVTRIVIWLTSQRTPR